MTTDLEVTVDLESSFVEVHRPMLEVTIDGGITGQGPPGPVGPAGPVGAQGAAGAQGVAGPVGPQGIEGPKGDEGEQGIAGSQGAPGSTGPQGVQGIQGSPGYGVDILGEKATIAALPSIAAAQPGDAWIVTADGNLYVAPQNLSAWVDAGQIVGPQGPQGIQGVAGPPGSAGPQGIQGVPGETGAQGTAGTAGTAGAQGPQGIQGVQGVPGVVPNPLNLTALQQVTEITVLDDGSATAGWPNRWAWYYDPLVGTKFLVCWNNEYGELRVTPAKVDTVGFRVHARNAVANTPHSGYIADVELARDSATVLWGIDEAGMYAAGNFRRPNNEGVQTQPVQRVLTQAQYDAIGTKDANCLYFIVG